MTRKKIVIFGGLGVIGSILAKHLSHNYDVLVADIKRNTKNEFNFIRVNASDLNDLKMKIPRGIDIFINLLGLPGKMNIVESKNEFNEMNDVYLQSTYTILLLATQLNVKRVIFASSNHVTDAYEIEGRSLFGREITVKDYPLSTNIYGVLKLASENLGYVFYKNKNLSVINIRIGTVKKDEKNAVSLNPRFQKTILSKLDLCNLFTAAIETSVTYGTYYGVSNNKDKPWSIENTISELGYTPLYNSTNILEK